MPVILNKRISQTPLEVVDEYKKMHPKLKNTAIGYAGRLDPMAEGLLMLLIGDENKDRKKYEELEKKYEFEILFGVATDSYDLMGMITESTHDLTVTHEQLKKAMESFVGRRRMPYPPYSSAAVCGKPLYWWTRRGKLREIAIPTKEIEIKKLEVSEWRNIQLSIVAQTAIERIEKVSGDFRQKAIVKQWQIVAKGQSDMPCRLAKCQVVCSSGTYVRGLVHALGRALLTPALTYSIRRTRIGMFTDSS